jgi:cysteine rich repeat protein
LAAFASALVLAPPSSVAFTNPNNPADAVCYSGWKPLSTKQRNTMRKFFLIATLLSLSAPAGALADQQHSGTPEEQKACAHDVQKFCRAVMDENDLTVLSCLQQNRPKLTKACELVLKNNGQ